MKEEKSVHHYVQHRKRLKERFSKAPEAASDAELIELLLGYVIKGRDVKPQSKEILAAAVNLGGIFESDMKSVRGVGNETILFFSVLREFICRTDYQKIDKKSVDMNSSSAVSKFLRSRIGYNNKETFIILFLDIKNKLITHRIVREGFVDSVAIAARDIIEGGIQHNASGVIFAHNHPSGDPTPSESDLLLTKQICHALRYTGITLLDHIIVTSNGDYSMCAKGYIKSFYDEWAVKL
ncbi:MAG: DNA repair protein RadC [Deferribacteraceae bacterium]|jgi:DNA repair protein RadC|nr:DNA repair protein RadC [Deferribacteraceae bacterium]